MTKLPEPILDKFLDYSWAVPSDVILRGCEALMWSDKKFSGRVLDIGCGEGNIGEIVFFNQGMIDVGMDLDAPNISRAARYSKYRKLVVGDARKMPFKNSSFSTVVSNSTFEHIEKSDFPAIKEVSRVLKPGGKFFITIPSDRYRDAIKSVINNDQEFAWYNDRVAHYRYRTLEEWTKVLSKNKLKIQSAQYYYSESVLPLWYRLFRISTTKINNRELWSYLRDSKYSKFLPKKYIIKLLKMFLPGQINRSLQGSGTWLFIIAKKV